VELSKRNLELLFSSHPIEEIHIRSDIFGCPFGSEFVKFPTMDTVHSLMNNLSNDQKDFFVS
jgi:hypothetical protein